MPLNLSPEFHLVYTTGKEQTNLFETSYFSGNSFKTTGISITILYKSILEFSVKFMLFMQNYEQNNKGRKYD